jgi:hypothetical protein
MKVYKTRNDDAIPVILDREITVSFRNFFMYARAQTFIAYYVTVFGLPQII